MLKDFELTFSPVTGEFLKTTYLNSDLILEYGSGGSTFLAASANKRVITVESDEVWLSKLIAKYDEKKLSGFIIPLLANIGKTENWGYPDDETQWKLWSQYPGLPWKYCKTHNLHPDVVLIDGRFRVASFIASCVCTEKPITLMFDDYVERRHYHCVENFVKPKQIIEERMAVFSISPGLVNAVQLLDNIEYFHRPE